MGIENSNLGAEQIDYSSETVQEQLAREYIAAHQEYTALMEKWQEQLRLKDRFEDENGHIQNDITEKAVNEYKSKMKEISDEMEVKQKTMRDKKSHLFGETVARFLR
jgi:hypothetical protein